MNLIDISLKLAAVICVFGTVFLNSCVTGSMPNLEKSECADSKEVLRKFYSIHFDREFQVNVENSDHLVFLTTELSEKVKNSSPENDYFTVKDDQTPHAFRLGVCKVISPEKTNVEVVFLWKLNLGSRQTILQAEVVKENGKWLINQILQ